MDMATFLKVDEVWQAIRLDVNHLPSATVTLSLAEREDSIELTISIKKPTQ